ncbi:MAG: phenylacetic acid degradation bifunctional protein PaaZ, partial [Meiothermus sp.]|nr:phenylacetic acid degradation bifunctional protein PaaZ [Meiothermus sp.]
MKLSSYLYGGWVEGDGDGALLLDAAYGRPVAAISSAGLDLGRAAHFARTVGNPNLQKLTFHQRANLLKALAQYLMDRKEEFYALSYKTGATRRDSWVDIEGGIGTLFSYASLSRRGLPNETFVVEDEPTPLSKSGSFVARHLLTSRRGVAVHINAYNFPVWGMLEKLAPSLIAGVPSIVKPAPQTVYLAERVVRAMDESGLLPEGAVQLLVGEPGNLLEVLDETDTVTFTGSAATGRRLKVHPNLIGHNVPFQMEADSLNATVLGMSVQPSDPEFELFVKEVGNEMVSKAGQKCTAIRRVIVPRGMEEPVIEALKQRLARTTIGDPSLEAVRMGALVDRTQLQRLSDNVAQIARSAETVLDGSKGFELIGGDPERGSFMGPTLLYCDRPLHAAEPHEVEAFGPVATVMPYQGLEEATELTRRGRGSLAGSIVTYDKAEARALFFGMASAHGRVLILNRDNAKESTGHGSPLPQLVHGGPGRAGGGEELGGLRSVRHYMQRTALQADPSTLAFLGNEWVRGAAVKEDPVHPFRKYFEDLEVGDSLLTHRRTVSEADIVNFAGVSGDYFYAHVDELAAKDSLFGKRVAHGYFLVSAAAGLFVWPGVGPVLANYGLENLRFVEPVGIGDTIQARLTVKKKTAKDPKPGEKATGVV